MNEVLWRRMQHFHFSDSHAHKDLKGRACILLKHL